MRGTTTVDSRGDIRTFPEKGRLIIEQNISLNDPVNIRFQFEANGITGKIKFDENGLRTDVTFEVVDLAAHGVNRVRQNETSEEAIEWIVQNGKWSANTPNRLDIQRNFTKDYEIRKQEIQHQKLKVTTVIVSETHCVDPLT